MITLKQVEAFYWAATLGSFAGASSKIHVAQSTVSKRILELETALGLELFDRVQRSGRITTKGTEILVLAEKLLRMRDRFMNAAHDKAAISGNLRVGITELVAMTWLPQFISEIRTTYPQLMVEPVVDQIVNLYARLEDRSIDLVIGPNVYTDERFICLPLAEVELAWHCCPSLYPGSRPMPVKELKKLPVLMQSAGSGLKSMLDNLLEKNGVRLSSVIYCNGMMAIAEMAASGLGITCLPRVRFASFVRSGRLKIVETTPAVPSLHYSVARRRDAVGSFGGIVSDLAVKVCDFNSFRVGPAPNVVALGEYKRSASTG